MKKYLLIALIILTFGNYGCCQGITSLFNTAKKPRLSDSLGYHTKNQYFPLIRAEKENCILSVDQSKVHFLYGTIYNNAKDCYLQVPVKLTNKSADTLKYIGMSCSWWDIYRTDNQSIKIFPPDICYKNAPMVYKLAPYQEIIVNIIVVFPKKAIKLQSFKIGMVMQKVTEFSHPGNIIWANSVLIPVVLSR